MKNQKNTVAPKATSFFRPQFGISTVLLLIAAAAIWISYWNAKKVSSRIESELPALWRIAGELRIEDPNQYAAVQVPPIFYRDQSWDIYLPSFPEQEPTTYELLLATQQVSFKSSRSKVRAEPVAMVDIGAGRHRIGLLIKRLESKEFKVEVRLDGESVINVVQPKDWRESISSSQRRVTNSVQHPVDQSLELVNIQYMVSDPARPNTRSTPKHPGAGIQLWIRQKDSSGNIE